MKTIRPYSLVLPALLAALLLGVAFMQPGDVSREVNRQAVGNLRDYETAVRKAGTERPLLFLVTRGDRMFYVTVSAGGD